MDSNPQLLDHTDNPCVFFLHDLDFGLRSPGAQRPAEQFSAKALQLSCRIRLLSVEQSAKPTGQSNDQTAALQALHAHRREKLRSLLSGEF